MEICILVQVHEHFTKKINTSCCWLVCINPILWFSSWFTDSFPGNCSIIDFTNFATHDIIGITIIIFSHCIFSFKRLLPFVPLLIWLMPRMIMTGPVKNTSSAGNSIKRKRQMDRERIATMSVQQSNKFNKKRRETRQRNKGQNVMPNCVRRWWNPSNLEWYMCVHKPTIGN